MNKRRVFPSYQVSFPSKNIMRGDSKRQVWRYYVLLWTIAKDGSVWDLWDPFNGLTWQTRRGAQRAFKLFLERMRLPVQLFGTGGETI